MIDFGGNAAIDPLDDAATGRDVTQAQQSISAGDLQTVIDQREIASTEREKQAQFENIARTATSRTGGPF